MLSANHYGSLVGFNIQDPNATNPWNGGLPLKKMQSVDMIIPTCLLAAKETKELFQKYQYYVRSAIHTSSKSAPMLISIEERAFMSRFIIISQ
jgi:alpha-galactosidase